MIDLPAMPPVEDGLAEGLQTTPCSTFDRAVERFTKSLTDEQKKTFQRCSIQDVCDSIDAIQNEHGSQNKLRNMARIQAFLEGMDEYRKVVEAFLNCTPFMGYIWVTHDSTQNTWPCSQRKIGTNKVYTSCEVQSLNQKRVVEHTPDDL